MNPSINKTLTSEMLKNKSDETVMHVLSASFEYLLAGMADEYCIVARIEDLEDFNIKNPFSWSQLLVNPFFVATSNGHSEALYSLFGEFQSFSFGPASMSVYRLIYENQKGHTNDEFSYFDIDLIDGLPQVKVKEQYINSTFKDIKLYIAGRTKLCIENEGLLFKDIYIYKDLGKSESRLVDTIDTGIEIIKNQAKSDFFTADTKSVLFKANYFDDFRENSYNDKVSVIDYDKIKNQRVKPFSEAKPENRLAPV